MSTVTFVLFCMFEDNNNLFWLQSETCSIEIPELELELGGGLIGGKFTTLEGTQLPLPCSWLLAIYILWLLLIVRNSFLLLITLFTYPKQSTRTELEIIFIVLIVMMIVNVVVAVAVIVIVWEVVAVMMMMSIDDERKGLGQQTFMKFHELP